MTLFKKKTQKPALLFCLKQQLENAKEKGETSFYYPLWEHEISLAAAWATHQHMLIEKDHITDGNVYYKFYGI
jgi:hypothetical protein